MSYFEERLNQSASSIKNLDSRRREVGRTMYGVILSYFEERHTQNASRIYHLDFRRRGEGSTMVCS